MKERYNIQSTSYRDILRLAIPLIVSMSGVMVMEFIDALFLSWHSAEAIAAVVPAGMAGYMLLSAFQGAAGYTSVFVSQYTGAGRPERAASVVWQGAYFAICAGLILAGFSVFSMKTFIRAPTTTAYILYNHMNKSKTVTKKCCGSSVRESIT